MLFSSMFFIYAFLPLLLIVYFMTKEEHRNGVLLAASLIFYSWGEPNYLVIMLLTIVVNYYAALFIERHRSRSFWILVGTILVNLSFLGYFKYFNFFVDNINYVAGTHFEFIKVIMPIGISFYTFQALSYVVDVYRKDVPAQPEFSKVALYISLFPQLVAGPIVKYHDVAEQISYRKSEPEMFYRGVRRFIIGLAKKVLIANNMGLVADKVFSAPVEQVDTLTSWIGAVCYSLQIFFDFSGYSDMAIGLGMIFGFRFMENFNYPYISSSITEFWRRWHISLSTWFKLYVYIPLGGNRVSTRRMYFNLLVVFFVTGFWHGAEWTFIVWGMWHGLFIVIEKITGWHKSSGRLLSRTFRHTATLFIVLVGWVFFRANDLSHATAYLKNMFGLVEHTYLPFGPAYFYDNIQIIAFVAGILFSLPAAKIVTERFENRIWFRPFYNAGLLALFALTSVFLAANTYNPFIYFRF